MAVTRAELQATLRSKGVKGLLSKMKKAELQALLEANTAPGQAPDQEGRGAPARKRKRGKTAYNVFVGKWMKEHKTNDMRAAVKAWKEQKGSGAPSKKAAQEGEGHGGPGAAQEGAGEAENEAGVHRMPDGSLMADDSPAMDMQSGEGEEGEEGEEGANTKTEKAEEQHGAGHGFGDWLEKQGHDFKTYWTEKSHEDHHELFLNVAQQAVDFFDGQQQNMSWHALNAISDDKEWGGVVDGALAMLLPGAGEAADAGLEGAELKASLKGARSAFKAGRTALERAALKSAGASDNPLVSAARAARVSNMGIRSLIDAGGEGAAKAGLKGVGRQVMSNVKKEFVPVAAAVAEHDISGAASGDGHGGGGGGGGGPPPNGPPNPYLGQAQRYAAYSASADQLNPFA